MHDREKERDVYAECAHSHASQVNTSGGKREVPYSVVSLGEAKDVQGKEDN
jgi:hypothetical protein